MSKLRVKEISPGNGIPLPVYAQIEIIETDGDKNNTISISPQLANSSQVDYHIDALIKELQVVRKKAKNILAQVHKL